MRADIKNIQQYLLELPDEQQKVLGHIYDLVKAEVPGAQESISYGMPAFKYKSKPLIYFGGFKDHMSIFPTSGPIEELKDDLKPFSSSKGTIQFDFDNMISDELIIKLIRVRLKQIDKG